MVQTVWVAVLALLIDRGGKIWALEWLAQQPDQRVAFWPGVFELRLVHNRGIAFSLFAGQTWLLVCLAVLALASVVWILHAVLRGGVCRNALIWLLLAGGVGNLIDRLLYGHVVDFMHLPWAFTFNFADVCITVSAALLIACLLRYPKDENAREAV